jgi:hypothetical protein
MGAAACFTPGTAASFMASPFPYDALGPRIPHFESPDRAIGVDGATLKSGHPQAIGGLLPGPRRAVSKRSQTTVAVPSNVDIVCGRKWLESVLAL